MLLSELNPSFGVLRLFAYSPSSHCFRWVVEGFCPWIAGTQEHTFVPHVVLLMAFLVAVAWVANELSMPSEVLQQLHVLSTYAPLSAY